MQLISSKQTADHKRMRLHSALEEFLAGGFARVRARVGVHLRMRARAQLSVVIYDSLLDATCLIQHQCYDQFYLLRGETLCTLMLANLQALEYWQELQEPMNMCHTTMLEDHPFFG